MDPETLSIPFHVLPVLVLSRREAGAFQLPRPPSMLHSLHAYAPWEGGPLDHVTVLLGVAAICSEGSWQF